MSRCYAVRDPSQCLIRSLTMPRVLVDLLSYTGTKGGMETYARELYRALGTLDTGYEFVGYASKEGYRLDHNWFPGEVLDSGISGENRFAWAYGELFSVARAAKRLGADLVHSPATLGPMRTRMPSVVTMHDMLYWSHPELMSTGMYTGPVKWMERRTSRNATRILTISDESASQIVKYLDFDEARLDVVPLAGTLIPGVDRSRAHSTTPMILATGNRRPHKNWPSLIRALPLIEPDLRPRLVITGSHGDDPLRPLVDELGLADWVELRSWVTTEEMAELYSTASAMAMPSFCDGFSLPALEAMMVGLPVMISDIPVYREVAGDAALYIDPNDLESIAGAMRTIAAEPAELDELVRRGFRRASAYSWERTARATLNTFEKALGRA